MPPSDAKKKWMKENTKVFTVRFNRGTEQDLIDFMESHPTAPTLKAALKEYIQNHPEA